MTADVARRAPARSVAAPLAGVLAVLAAFRLQASLTRRSPGQSLVLVTAPLFAVIFLSLALHSHEPSALINAVLAPGLIGLWVICLDVAGTLIDEDRRGGRLELLLGGPTPLAALIFGRVCFVVLFGALTFVESWLVAVLGFRVHLTVHHWLLFAVVLVVTGIAAAATATLLSAAFVMSRALHVYQNFLTYPVYILGGVLVPVASLPGWLGPPSRIVFMSWSADLLRDCMRAAPVHDFLPRLGALAGLAVLALVAGLLLIRLICNRLRTTGEVNRA
jgi:ABC-2 type transport system permease protein